MTTDLDDLTLTLKPNYVTITKAIGDTKVKHISLLILKIKVFYPYLHVGSKYTKLTLYLGTESKKPDINPIYGLIELF